MAITYDAARTAPLLSIEGERQLIRDWQTEKDQNALEKILLSHARLVFAWARKLGANRSEQEELLSEGMMGLIKAADMFDLDRGVRFSTYARWWVKNAALASYHSMRCVVQQPSKAPGEEAAEPAPVTEGSLALLELPSTDPTPEEQMISSSSRAAIKRQLDGALGNLDPLGREVLVSRMLQQPPEPVSELAARLDISASKLRQLERRSMLRLRQDLISRGVHSSRVQ